MKFLWVFCAIALLAPRVVSNYQIPNVNLELTEQGFRVSIPDESGVKRVSINVNRNRPFKFLEPGEFSAQIRKVSQDCSCWLYDINSALQNNDTIFVWVSVQHHEQVYRNVATSMFRVDIVKNSINPISNTTKCPKSITLVNNNPTCSGELIFATHFDKVLDKNIWKPDVFLGDYDGDSNFVLYAESQLDIKNGALVITPQERNNLSDETINVRDTCTAVENYEQRCYRDAKTFYDLLPPIVSGRISTKGYFSFKYGRVEIKAKLPQGDWLCPMLLLEPLRNAYGAKDFASGQLRLAFARGNTNLTIQNEDIGGNVLYGGTITNPEATLREKGTYKRFSTKHFGNDYHVYTTIWTDEQITFKVDGQDYGVTYGGFIPKDNSVRRRWEKGSKMAPFDQEFYITLGVAAGGHGDFPDGSLSSGKVKPWNNTHPKSIRDFWKLRNDWKSSWNDDKSLQVEYIRVYAI